MTKTKHFCGIVRNVLSIIVTNAIKLFLNIKTLFSVTSAVTQGFIKNALGFLISLTVINDGSDGIVILHVFFFISLEPNKIFDIKTNYLILKQKSKLKMRKAL